MQSWLTIRESASASPTTQFCDQRWLWSMLFGSIVRKFGGVQHRVRSPIERPLAFKKLKSRTQTPSSGGVCVLAHCFYILRVWYNFGTVAPWHDRERDQRQTIR